MFCFLFYLLFAWDELEDGSLNWLNSGMCFLAVFKTEADRNSNQNEKEECGDHTSIDLEDEKVIMIIARRMDEFARGGPDSSTLPLPPR
ncbi:hypothetical protein AtNW77_Chr2g0228971 [Arabidopsis thaliana]